MRWKQVAWVLWLAGLTGCPHAFGRGGTLERAVAKDVKENAAQPLVRCSKQVLEELCPPYQEPSHECLEVCGDELEERELW
jgi:hypothetical protein